MGYQRTCAIPSLLVTLFTLAAGCAQEPALTGPRADSVGDSILPASSGTQMWAPPEGLSLPTGRLYRLSTANEEEPAVVHGGGDVTFVAHLADPTGKRELKLSWSGQGGATAVAPAGWNILPVAAVLPSGQVLACWNRLVGPEGPDGGLPHPSAGLELRCRYGAPGALSEPFLVGHDAFPAWLVDLGVSDGAFTVAYLRNASGWIVGPAAEGDGLFHRTYDGQVLSEPLRLSP